MFSKAFTKAVETPRVAQLRI